MYQKSSLLILIIIFLSGCSEDNIEPQPDLPFFPYTFGNVWKYKVIEYDSISHNKSKEFVDSIKIWSETIINFNPFNELNQFPIIYTLNSGVNLFQTEDFLFISPKFGNVGEMKFPKKIKIGDTLTYSHRFIEIIDNNFKINTPIGVFHCIVYKSSPVNSYIISDPYIHYISPGTGLIKFEQYIKKDNEMNLIRSWLLIEKNF